MRKADKLTWLSLTGLLCIALYFVSDHPLRAAQYRYPALNRPVIDAAFAPARCVAEFPSLNRPMQYWARVWGQDTRCRASLRNLRLAVHNDMAGNDPIAAASSDEVVSGPSQFPPID